MQTIVIAVLIVIAGLIGALLVCATSLISRARVATTTLRRIEETLLAMNRVRAIDSAIKSAEPLKQSQTADAGTASFLTLRELKTMSGAGGPDTGAAQVSNRRSPFRTSAPSRPFTHPLRARERESSQAVQGTGIAAHDAVGANLELVDSLRTTDGFARQEPRFEVSDVAPNLKMPAASEQQNSLESSIEISWPGLNQQISNLELQKEAHDAVAGEGLSEVAAVTHSTPAANSALVIANADAAKQETVVAISARSGAAPAETPPEVSTPRIDTRVGPDAAMAAEPAAGGETAHSVRVDELASTGHDLDEARRKKKEQEVMLIISSRRRRARGGR